MIDEVPFVFSNQFNWEMINMFRDMYGSCASTHTLNTQKCLEHVLNTEAGKHSGPMANVYSILAKVLSEEYTEVEIGDEEQAILYCLFRDLCERIGKCSLERVIEMMDRKLSKAMSKGISEIQHKKNPLGLKSTSLDVLKH